MTQCPSNSYAKLGYDAAEA
jgi:hypothetical protein